LALTTKRFVEVHESTSIHRVPHLSSPSFLGLANLRGTLHLCFSISQLLGLEATIKTLPQSDRHTPQPRLIVIEKDGERWATPVDRVEGLIRYSQEDIQKASVTISNAASTFTFGMLESEKRRIALLDEELLFYQLKNHLLQ